MARSYKKIVDLGNLRIRKMDNRNYILEEWVVPKQGSKREKPDWEIFGYYPKLEYLVWPIINKQIKGSECDNVLKCLEDIKQEIDSIGKQLIEKLEELLKEEKK